MCDEQRPWDHITREREDYLVDEMGLHSASLQYLKRIAPRLCDGESAKRRILNLYELGFSDPIALINYNPTLIMRRRATISEKVQLWTSWLRRHQLSESVNALSFKYPQMYTASITKLRVIFAISDVVKTNVTASRMCNMITLNVEDILCACLWQKYRDFALLRLDVIRSMRPLQKMKKSKKRETILRRIHALPPQVADAYRAYIGVL